MKIGIEAQRIFRKKKHGMDIVALQLIRELQKADTENAYFIFVKEDEDHGVLQETPNFKIITIKSAPYPYWEQVLLPREAKKYGVDVLHCTSNTAPIRIDIPLVITVHDIIYLEKVNLTAGTWYQRLGNLYRRWNVPAVAGKSARIITVSDYERERIINHFALPTNHVQTVYNGVGEKFRRVTDTSKLQQIREKYNLPNRYIFYLGNTDPKKNMIGVMRALSHLRKNNALEIPLLMLDIDRSYLHRIATQIGDTEILSHITFCGYVPNDELPMIYSMADIFLYPSLRESFGIPILEAMACGTPVITANTSSMPEVAGDAALFIDPFSPVDIASAITSMLQNQSLRDDLTQKGLARSGMFSWKNNALQTLSLYKAVVDEK